MLNMLMYSFWLIVPKLELNFVLLCFFLLAQDCERPIRDTMSLTDEDIQKEHIPSGSFVTFVCEMGYRSAGGSGKTTCVAGTWTPSTLRCESEYYLF